MVNFDLVIKRIEDLKGVRGDKHVAAILGLSPQDFSNRKKRGSLLPAIFEWAINESVNLDWLIKGQECDPEAKPAIGDQSVVYAMFGTDTEMQEIVDLLQKRVPELKGNVLKILKAKAGLKDALNEMGLKESDWF